MEDIGSCHQQLQDLATHLWNPESKSVKDLNKRRYYKIVIKSRFGRWKCGTGRSKIENVDERFILDWIENKSTEDVDGRCHDVVMYTRRRVKKYDFLKAANFSRTKNNK